MDTNHYDTGPLPESGSFEAAVLHCSDGRFAPHVEEFLTGSLGLARVDRVAVPGGAGALARKATAADRRAVTDALGFLIEAHSLPRVILISHEDCGYYAQRFNLTGDAALAAQRDDLAWAGATVRKLGKDFTIDAFQLGRAFGQVRFERVPLAEDVRGS